jgi:hypothetical protein
VAPKRDQNGGHTYDGKDVGAGEIEGVLNRQPASRLSIL